MIIYVYICTGLAWLLTIWAIVGAIVFCAIEGPREREQVIKLKNMQKDLAIGLATELRQLRTDKEEDLEPLWSNKVKQYVSKHEKLLLMAVNSGYGENGNSGELWTFSGCILFALSLLTTLGNLDLFFIFLFLFNSGNYDNIINNIILIERFYYYFQIIKNIILTTFQCIFNNIFSFNSYYLYIFK